MNISIVWPSRRSFTRPHVWAAARAKALELAAHSHDPDERAAALRCLINLWGSDDSGIHDLLLDRIRLETEPSLIWMLATVATNKFHAGDAVRQALTERFNCDDENVTRQTVLQILFALFCRNLQVRKLLSEVAFGEPDARVRRLAALQLGVTPSSAGFRQSCPTDG